MNKLKSIFILTIMISSIVFPNSFAENNNTSSSSRGYTREEIHSMLNCAKWAMDRAIILVASSSGIRPGAMEFNWDDITPVYKVDNKID